MKFTDRVSVTFPKKDPSIVWLCCDNIGWVKVTNIMRRSSLKVLTKAYKNRKIDDDNFYRQCKIIYDECSEATKDERAQEENLKTAKENLSTAMSNLIKFFSEFDFEPNYRFVNTLALYATKSGLRGAKEFLENYFVLTNNSRAKSIVNKSNSSEFSQIVTSLISYSHPNKVNSRLKIYYGSQGTGKTTKAISEADGNVVVCHSAMLPSDLMEDFQFSDGKAEFTPSAFCRAMMEGKPIVLDEINLLPFESLRFLQSLLDNKPSIVYKGKTIEIKDGFQVIGTMNLVVNGSVYELPEPLVDRCSELKKFSLTGSDLIQSLV